MTSSKAIAGGAVANVVVLVSWYLSTIDWIAAMPIEPKAALLSLVITAIGSLTVYFAPANRQVMTADMKRIMAEVGEFSAALAAMRDGRVPQSPTSTLGLNGATK